VIMPYQIPLNRLGLPRASHMSELRDGVMREALEACPVTAVIAPLNAI
jgi:hypothetical protein